MTEPNEREKKIANEMSWIYPSKLMQCLADYRAKILQEATERAFNLVKIVDRDYAIIKTKKVTREEFIAAIKGE